CPGDEGCSGEAGRHAIAVLGDELGQPVAGGLTDLRVEEAEVDRERVDGGAVGPAPATVLDVVAIEDDPGPLGKVRPSSGIVGPAQQRGGVGGPRRAAVEAGG